MNFDIDIKVINVLNIGSSSGIFSGENYHSQWRAMAKSNTGIELSGQSNMSKNSVNIVDDSDLLDLIRVPRLNRKNIKK